MNDFVERAKVICDKREAELEIERGNKPPPSICNQCNANIDPFLVPNFGWKTTSICTVCGEKERVKQEQEQLIAETNKLIEYSGLIGILKEMSFNSYKGHNQALLTAKEYAENFDSNIKHGLYFYGRPGSGKTHLACAITKYIIKTKLIPVIFVQSIDLLLELRDFDKKVSELEMIERFTNIPLLIIDDFGTEKLTDWAQQVFYKIINDRLLTKKPIIITTNYNLQELENRLGERISSRIASICKVIKMQDINYRLERKV